MFEEAIKQMKSPPPSSRRKARKKKSLKNHLSDTSSEESDGGVRCNRQAGSSGGARGSKNGVGKRIIRIIRDGDDVSRFRLLLLFFSFD